VLHQALVFVPLAIAIVSLGVLAVYGRMTTQRKWREWLTERLVERLLAHGHYYQLNLVRGDHQNPEARISQDARVATDPPVDFAVGILSSTVTAITFIGVLWFVGGNLAIETAGMSVFIPRYLVLAAIIYSMLASLAMVAIARRFVTVSEAVNQTEAEFRYALTRLRDNGESIALLGGEKEEQEGLRRSLGRYRLVLACRRSRATRPKVANWSFCASSKLLNSGSSASASCFNAVLALLRSSTRWRKRSMGFVDFCS
jgi:putative ATP-binding cassette transporter